MTEGKRFRARLESARGGGAAFDVPVDVAAALDTFDVAITLYTQPRTIDVPRDLAEALAAAPAAAAGYDRLSFSHRREYVQWITEAKRHETRARRVAGTLDRLRADEEPAT